jgi:hypothetical protein
MAWKKGQSGNPKGRQKKPEIEKLREALAKVEKEQDKTFLEHFVAKAFEEKEYAIALAKKILPDLRTLDVSMAEGLVINIISENGKKRKS